MCRANQPPGTIYRSERHRGMQHMPNTAVNQQTSQIADWMRLSALELNPVRAHELLDAFQGDPSAIFSVGSSEIRKYQPQMTENQCQRFVDVQKRSFTKEQDVMGKLGATCVTVQDHNYPSSLKQLPDAPPVLFVRGTLQSEFKFSVAIVGSRRASSYGLTLSGHFAKELANHGLTIVSGGARGVDTQAHRGALDAGGRTVAFIGSGIDVTYPKDNKKLFEDIVDQGGAIISEYVVGTRPEPWRFPARNRLISGLSLGVLVIESPMDSGSLITAREAADQGRDVFAIPGPIDTGRNSGCHKLIQDGAKLVENVDDILNELGVLALKSPGAPSGSAGSQRTQLSLPPEQRLILDMLDLQAKTVDSLIVASRINAPQVVGILTMLEMKGLARRVAGNAFIRVL